MTQVQNTAQYTLDCARIYLRWVVMTQLLIELDLSSELTKHAMKLSLCRCQLLVVRLNLMGQTEQNPQETQH